MWRRLLEKFSRGRVLKRRMPGRLGGDVVWVSPDSALSYWKQDLERVAKDLFDLADEFVQPGNVVWDVGASLGLFAFAAASRAGRAA